MITETAKIKLANNLDYALSLQFIDKLEKNNKINSEEKLCLKEAIEDNIGKLQHGDIPKHLKKEIKSIQIEDSREEKYDKEFKTNYMREGRYNN